MDMEAMQCPGERPRHPQSSRLLGDTWPVLGEETLSKGTAGQRTKQCQVLPLRLVTGQSLTPVVLSAHSMPDPLLL